MVTQQALLLVAHLLATFLILICTHTTVWLITYVVILAANCTARLITNSIC